MSATNRNAIEQLAADWLARRVSDSWSSEQQAELDAWLAESTAHRIAWLRLEATWAETGRLKALAAGRASGEVPARGEWAKPVAPRAFVDTEASAGEVPRRNTLRVGVAAALLLVCSALGVWAWRTYTAVETAQYAAAVGDMREVQLADQSLATLSSGSRIAVAMSRDSRAIELQSGEAFFTAAHEQSRPFVVTAAERRVVAVGTKFAVRREGADLRVVVTEGLVRLESVTVAGQPAAPVTLLPAGSIATASPNGVVVRSGSVAEAERALDWRSGYLQFQDTPLAEVVAEFSRYSGQQLVTGDAEAAALRIGGNFRWSNVDGFVRVLEKGFGIRAERQGEQIVLRSR
jgi:transmembrane sensor